VPGLQTAQNQTAAGKNKWVKMGEERGEKEKETKALTLAPRKLLIN